MQLIHFQIIVIDLKNKLNFLPTKKSKLKPETVSIRKALKALD